MSTRGPNWPSAFPGQPSIDSIACITRVRFGKRQVAKMGVKWTLVSGFRMWRYKYRRRSVRSNTCCFCYQMRLVLAFRTRVSASASSLTSAGIKDRSIDFHRRTETIGLVHISSIQPPDSHWLEWDVREVGTKSYPRPWQLRWPALEYPGVHPITEALAVTHAAMILPLSLVRYNT